MDIIARIKCKLGYHSWIFPFRVRDRLICTSDYKCRHCGITRDMIEGERILPELSSWTESP
jgi:hypothetical protein